MYNHETRRNRKEVEIVKPDFIYCNRRKRGRKIRVDPAVCEQCRKNRKCTEYHAYIQPELVPKEIQMTITMKF